MSNNNTLKLMSVILLQSLANQRNKSKLTSVIEFNMFNINYFILLFGIGFFLFGNQKIKHERHIN